MEVCSSTEMGALEWPRILGTGDHGPKTDRNRPRSVPVNAFSTADSPCRVVGIPPTEVVNVAECRATRERHRLTRSRTLEPSAHAVLVVPRPVGDCEWVPLRRNPGRMDATIKLMVVQVNNNDPPDHSDKIRAPPMRLKCSSRVDRTSHFLDLIWTLRPRPEQSGRERSHAANPRFGTLDTARDRLQIASGSFFSLALAS